MKRRILFIHNNLGGGGAEGALIEVLNHLVITDMMSRFFALPHW